MIDFYNFIYLLNDYLILLLFLFYQTFYHFRCTATISDLWSDIVALESLFRPHVDENDCIINSKTVYNYRTNTILFILFVDIILNIIFIELLDYRHIFII